jgi:predicted nucleotidyltransferase
MSGTLDVVNLGSPITDLLPGVRGRLLTTLGHLAKPVTVRELARFAGTSPQSALEVIDDLTEVGLVFVELAGRAHMVTLNRDHLLAEPVLAAIETRRRLVHHLTDEIAGWSDLAGAWLFGSAARGSGDRGSDIDLLLVAKETTETAEWIDATSTLTTYVRSWTGNVAQLVEHTRESFAKLVATGNPLVAAIRTDGIPLTRTSRALLRPIR